MVSQIDKPLDYVIHSAGYFMEEKDASQEKPSGPHAYKSVLWKASEASSGLLTSFVAASIFPPTTANQRFAEKKCLGASQPAG
eukprot:3732115-Amphidinium_carterae.1